MQKFGYSDLSQIIGLTIKYIDTDETLRNLICLNRDMNEILREECLRQSLLLADTNRVESKRKELWLQILKVDR